MHKNLLKSAVSLLLLYLPFLIAVGQSDFPYQLEGVGEIPKEFITASSVKYSKKISEVENSKEYKEDRRKAKKTKKQFYLESHFGIDDILQSGYVLYNDELSTYVQKVFDNIPLDSHLKKKKPRVYLLRSSAVNAFATDQGIVFVTLGLLARLESEAQLAFILCHELVHIKHEHVLDKFFVSKKLNAASQKETMKRLGIDNEIFSQSFFSVKLEEEADEEGYELFLQTKYSGEDLDGVFKVLYYSYLPFEEMAFPKNFFDDEHYVLPAYAWLDSTSAISGMNEGLGLLDDDQERTHPSSLSRLLKLSSELEDADNSGKAIYLEGERQFEKMQWLARYQLPFIDLENENHPAAVYNAFVLLNEYPNNPELKKVIAKALYMESVQRNFEENSVQAASRRYKYVDKMEGESQQVVAMFHQLDDEELNVLALKYNYDLSQEIKDDSELERMSVHLARDLLDHHEEKVVFDESPESKLEHDKAAAKNRSKGTMNKALEKKKESKKEGLLSSNRKSLLPSKEESKEPEEAIEPEALESIEPVALKINVPQTDPIDQLKDKKKVAGEIEKEYWHYAFVDSYKSESFNNMFDKATEEYEYLEELRAYYDSEEGLDELKKENKDKIKNGQSLGIKKVVVINPFYLTVDARKANAIQLIESEKNQSRLRNKMKQAAKASPLKVQMMDVTALKKSDTDRFNDIATIHQYFKQQISNYDMGRTVGLEQNKVNEIIEQYGTKYFLWTGVVSLRKPTNINIYHIGCSVVFPYIIPFVLAKAIRPNVETFYYAMLYDVESGRRSVMKIESFDTKDSDAFLSAHIYDVFNQLNK